MEIKVGNDSFESFELCAGDNVKVVSDKETGKVFISAPVINYTRLKNGPFPISGECVEIEAGSNIIISSVHPNKMVIGADLSKETLRIVNLERRVENLEKTIVTLLKKK